MPFSLCHCEYPYPQKVIPVNRLARHHLPVHRSDNRLFGHRELWDRGTVIHARVVGIEPVLVAVATIPERLA